MRRALPWLAALGAMQAALALQFYLPADESQCFTDMLHGSTKVMGEYVVASGRGDMAVDLVVKDEQDRQVYAQDNLDHGRFSFTTPYHGPEYSDYDEYYSDDEAWGARKYEICLRGRRTGAEGGPALRRRVGFALALGDTAKDYAALAKDQHLTELEVSLRAMGDELHNLLRELEFVRVREDHLRKVNESTNTKVVSFSIVSCLVMFLVGAYQMYYLRTYFKKKKLL